MKIYVQICEEVYIKNADSHQKEILTVCIWFSLHVVRLLLHTWFAKHISPLGCIRSCVYNFFWHFYMHKSLFIYHINA